MSARGPSFWLKTGLGAALVVLLTVTGVVAGRKPAAANAALPLALSSALLVPPDTHHAATPSPLAEPNAPAQANPAGDPPAPPTPAPPAPGPGLLPDGRVVLNAATEEDLRKLPRVGPSRAKSILALRTKLGKFRSVNDLLRVKGIGRKTLEHLKPKMVLDPPPAAPA